MSVCEAILSLLHLFIFLKCLLMFCSCPPSHLFWTVYNMWGEWMLFSLGSLPQFLWEDLCYPLGITIIVNNNKLMNGHLCFVHPVPLQGGDVLSVTAVHHHFCYRYIPLQLWIKLNFTESTDPCLIHCLSLHLFWNAPWMRQRQEKWPVVM